MKIILFDSKKIKQVYEDELETAPHVIRWNGLTYVRFGVQNKSAFYEEAEVISL
jgi:hypothetical protein